VSGEERARGCGCRPPRRERVLLTCVPTRLNMGQAAEMLPTKGYHFPDGPYVEYEGTPFMPAPQSASPPTKRLLRARRGRGGWGAEGRRAPICFTHGTSTLARFGGVRWALAGKVPAEERGALAQALTECARKLIAQGSQVRVVDATYAQVYIVVVGGGHTRAMPSTKRAMHRRPQAGCAIAHVSLRACVG
jgi:hypothetical protein